MKRAYRIVKVLSATTVVNHTKRTTIVILMMKEIIYATTVEAQVMIG